MKTTHTISKLVITSLVALSAALPAHKAESAPLSPAPVSIQWYAASLPRQEDSGVAQGASWPSAAANWMSAIRANSLTAVGTGRASALNITYVDYLGMVTSSSFNSWRSNAEFIPSDLEYGNRQYFGMKVVAQTGSFIPANITYNITTEIWNGSSWAPVLFNNVPASMAVDGNVFRQRLDAGHDTIFGSSDDVPSASQLMSLPSNCFIYGGYGIGVGAYGSGGPQQQLNNALSYIQSNKLRVLLTVTVPYSNETTYTFNTIYMPPAQNIQAIYLPPSGSIPTYVNWSSSNGMLYSVESSTDLVDWNNPLRPIVYLNGVAGSTFQAVLDQHNGVNKCFYRVKQYLP